MNTEQLDQLRKTLDREPYVLDWSVEGIEDLKHTHSSSEAFLGEPDDGVHFSMTHHPTCYRRGRWRLFITINSGQGYYKWGCFDDQDQPLRYYHLKESLLKEADEIARTLIIDRVKRGPLDDSSQ